MATVRRLKVCRDAAPLMDCVVQARATLARSCPSPAPEVRGWPCGKCANGDQWALTRRLACSGFREWRCFASAPPFSQSSADGSTAGDALCERRVCTAAPLTAGRAAATTTPTDSSTPSRTRTWKVRAQAHGATAFDCNGAAHIHTGSGVPSLGMVAVMPVAQLPDAKLVALDYGYRSSFTHDK